MRPGARRTLTVVLLALFAQASLALAWIHAPSHTVEMAFWIALASMFAAASRMWWEMVR